MSKRRRSRPVQLSLSVPGKKIQLAPGVYTVKQEDNDVSLFLESAELPVPDRSMFANWVSATRREVDVQITFGQWTGETERLSAAVIISMSGENVARSIHGDNARFRVDLSERVGDDRRIGDVEKAPELPGHAERTVWYRASIMNLAYAGSEAEIRFYFLSPRSIHDLRTGLAKAAGKSLVVPVVRIDLSIENLERLCRRLAELVSEDEFPGVRPVEREEV